MRKQLIYLSLFAASLFTACTGLPKAFSDGEDVSIFPDYTDITIPANIAPVKQMEKADRTGPHNRNRL